MSVVTSQDRARGTRSPNETTGPQHSLPPRDPKFTGRFEELRQLSELLVRDDVVGISQSPAPHTQGGLGKTATAIAYGWKHLDEYPGGVYFVDANSGLLIAELAKVAPLLGLESVANEQTVAEQVRRHLAAGPPSLLILDGLDDSSIWNRTQQMKLLPAGNCRCLITTARANLADVKMCVLGRLPRDHGVRLIASFRPDATERENEPIAGEIVDWFDGLPIGLSLVGAWMALNPEWTWAGCRKRLMELGVGTSAERRRGQMETPNYVELVHAVLDEVLESLPMQLRFGIEYAALLPDNRIVMSWLSQLAQSEEATKVAKILGEVQTGDQAVAALLSLQLLRAQSPGYKMITMPRILRSRMKRRFEEGSFRNDRAFEHVLAKALQRTEATDQALQKKSLRAELSPLVDFAKDLKHHDRLREGAKIANQLALVLHRLGRFHEVIDLLDNYLDDEVTQRMEPTVVAVLLSDKAVTLAELGQKEEARRLMDRALQLEQRHLPADHPTIAAHYSNLAGILKSLGEFAKARRLLEQSIEIEKKHFGADHPALALRHWWLGDLDVAEKRRPDAAASYHRAHEIMVKHLPPDHAHLLMLSKILEQLGHPVPPRSDE